MLKHRLAVTVLAFSVASGAAIAQPRNFGVSRAQPAGESRTALVIGNGDYRESPLKNPVNDARSIAEALRSMNFQVKLLENADRDAMFEAIREFGDRLNVAPGVALFYFAGHGVQIRGRNYLVPVAATISREDEVAHVSIDAAQVVDKMESARNRVNIVILDACRNNPFARSLRGVQPGLAVMEAPVNTLVAFATAPGATASDGASEHGLYTEHLLKNLSTEGLLLEDMFKRVRAGVREGSSGRQVPWENTSLEVEFYFKPKPEALPFASAGTAPGLVAPLAVELTFWESIRSSQSADDFDAYVRRFPQGQFIELARNRLNLLRSSYRPPQVLASQPILNVSAAPAAQSVAVDPDTGAASGQTAATVTVVGLSANGRYAVTGGGDGTLKVWDVVTHAELRCLKGHSGRVLAVAFSADGRSFASGGEDGIARLWSLASGNEIKRFTGHGAPVVAVAFSPNSRYVASGDSAGAIRLWSAVEGVELNRFAGHPQGTRALIFSADGRLIVSGGNDRMVRVWDVSNGGEASRLGPHASPVLALGIALDGSEIVSASGDGLVHIWSVKQARIARQFNADAPVLRLSSDGGRVFAARENGQAILWDSAQARELGRYAELPLAASVTAISANGAYGMLAAGDHSVRLLAFNKGEGNHAFEISLRQ